MASAIEATWLDKLSLEGFAHHLGQHTNAEFKLTKKSSSVFHQKLVSLAFDNTLAVAALQHIKVKGSSTDCLC